jgi:hypothetical protein
MPTSGSLPLRSDESGPSCRSICHQSNTHFFAQHASHLLSLVITSAITWGEVVGSWFRCCLVIGVVDIFWSVCRPVLDIFAGGPACHCQRPGAGSWSWWGWGAWIWGSSSGIPAPIASSGMHCGLRAAGAGSREWEWVGVLFWLMAINY